MAKTTKKPSKKTIVVDTLDYHYPKQNPKTQKLQQKADHLRLQKEVLRHQLDLKDLKNGKRPKGFY